MAAVRMSDRISPCLTRESAREYVATRALTPGPIGRVGLELESHLVDLAHPPQRPSWERLSAALDGLGPLPGGSRVTVEPGGQVELSTVPATSALDAVEALHHDHAIARAALAERGLGLACLGADPIREAARVNPAPRYAAMEAYFAASGNAAAGAAMMCSTASLQVNLDAGPATGWSDRVALAHRLGPVLVAMSACSPFLRGRATGWRSTRQRIWGELDRARCGPLLSGSDPAGEWADYVLAAPVMMVRHPGAATPVLTPVSFDSWAGGVDLAGRPPTETDLDYHLTTVFPPVRLRGFLEIRYLDAVPPAWWPALAAIVVALLDDPAAANSAAEATEPLAGAWTDAAHAGLADERLARAARRCLDAALPAVHPRLRADAERFAELVLAGRSPGDAFADRAALVGPGAALREIAGA